MAGVERVGMPRTETWECRLCKSHTFDRDEMQAHLMFVHGMPQTAVEGLAGRLHAAVDHADHSENTLGWYDGEKLVCLSLTVAERDPDDPMRDEFWQLP